MTTILSSLSVLLLPFNPVEVEMPDGNGKIPGQVKILPFAELFCVEHQTIPRKSPIKDGPSGARALSFGEGLRWLEYHQGKDANYYLVCKGGFFEPISVIGWVPDSALLLGGSPVTTSFLRQDDVHKGLQGGGPGVSRKALIVCSREWLQENLNPGNGPKDFIAEPFRYLGLLPNAPKADPLRFYNILFVYKIDTVKKMVLLGFSEKLSVDDNSSDLAGWVSDKAVCFWDSREAVQWKFDNKNSEVGSKTRQTKVYAFATLQDLRNFQASFKNRIRIPDGMPGAINPDLKTIIAEEVVDPKTGNSEKWDFDDVRFPLLSKPVDQHVDTANWGRVLEIGVIGSFRKKNGELVKANKINELRNQLGEIEKEVKQNFIMFVIDNTGSMEKAFQTIIPQYIQAFVSEQGLTDVEKSQIKIAVTFYNDFPSSAEKQKAGASLDQTVKMVSDWVSFGSPEGKALITSLSNSKAQEGGDALEQPIHGIRTALRNAMKSNKAPPGFAFKRLVVIGDMGNHEKDNLGQDITKEMDAIVEMLVPINGSPWDFIPIQVPNPRGIQGQPDPEYDLYRTQMNQLARLRIKRLQENARKKKLPEVKMENEFVVNRNFDDLKKYLVDRTREYRKEAIRDFENLVELRRGVTTKMSDNLKNIFKDMNLDIDVLAEKGFQYYDRGWITTHDGTYRDDHPDPVPQIDIKTLIRNDEFESMVQLVNSFDPQSFNKFASQIFAFVVAGKLGQHLNEEFMKTIIDKLGSINSHTPLIDYMVKARFNKEFVPLTDSQVKERFAELLTRIEKLKPIYKEIKAEGKFSGGIHPIKQTLPSGIQIDVWEGKGQMDLSPENKRKFKLVGDRGFDISGKKDFASNFYYWFDDRKEIP